MSLFGPKGELRGALLEDGNLVCLGEKEAIDVADLLRPEGHLRRTVKASNSPMAASSPPPRSDRISRACAP
jgi:hypothetical protein